MLDKSLPTKEWLQIYLKKKRSFIIGSLVCTCFLVGYGIYEDAWSINESKLVNTQDEPISFDKDKGKERFTVDKKSKKTSKENSKETSKKKEGNLKGEAKVKALMALDAAIRPYPMSNPFGDEKTLVSSSTVKKEENLQKSPTSIGNKLNSPRGALEEITEFNSRKSIKTSLPRAGHVKFSSYKGNDEKDVKVVVNNIQPRLLGLIGGDQGQAILSLQGETKSLGLGDSIGEFTLLKIEDGGVLLSKDGESLWISI